MKRIKTLIEWTWYCQTHNIITKAETPSGRTAFRNKHKKCNVIRTLYCRICKEICYAKRAEGRFMFRKRHTKRCGLKWKGKENILK